MEIILANKPFEVPKTPKDGFKRVGSENCLEFITNVKCENDCNNPPSHRGKRKK